jgi:pimeloyl-ACP methyl ester carboxylesterase
MSRFIPYLATLVTASLAVSLSATSASAAIQDAAPVVTPFQAESSQGHIAGEIHQLGDRRAETVVIVSGGSGVGERNDTAAAVGLFLSEDVAVAIYDRRGFGQSSGEAIRPGTANSKTLIPALGEDVADIAGHLTTLGYSRVGLLGSSMGGWINAAAANGSDDIAFAVSIVGGAVPVATSDTFDALTDSGASIETALARARSVVVETGYDPHPDLSSVEIPMLWILAACDDSNPSQLDIEAIEALQSAGKTFAYTLVEQADHNFLNPETGQPVLDWVPEVHEFVRTAGRQ